MCTSSAGHELACPQGHMSDLYPRQMNVRSGVSTTHSVLSCLRLWLCRLRCKGPSYTYAQWCFENLLCAKLREWRFDLPSQMQGSELHMCAVVFRKPIACKESTHRIQVNCHKERDSISANIGISIRNTSTSVKNTSGSCYLNITLFSAPNTTNLSPIQPYNQPSIHPTNQPA